MINTTSIKESLDIRDKTTYAFKKILWIFAPCALLTVTLPSSKDVAILVGVHYANKLIESPENAKVQTLLRAKANDILDNEIKKLEKK